MGLRAEDQDLEVLHVEVLDAQMEACPCLREVAFPAGLHAGVALEDHGPSTHAEEAFLEAFQAANLQVAPWLAVLLEVPSLEANPLVLV